MAKASGKGKKKAGDPARLKRDPEFMKNLETAVRDEYSKTKRAVPAEPSGPQKTAATTLATAKAAAPAKKAPAPKKAPAAKKASGKSSGDEREALAIELRSLIPELDAEGLAFLIEQARVHLYNMRVVDLEAAVEEAERASTRARKAGSAKGAAKASAAPEALSIKAASDGSAYDLVYNGKWKMFTGDEMLAMVRIASNKDPVDQVGGRLYRWLLAERSDAINDLGLSGLADPLLRKLVVLLRKTFTIKGAE